MLMYRSCKKDSSWNPSTCICDNGKYLDGISDTSRIVCDGIINITHSRIIYQSTKVTNTVTTHVMSTASLNSDDKK